MKVMYFTQEGEHQHTVPRQKKTSINTRLPQHDHLAIIERQSKVIRPKEVPMDYIKISNAREGCLKNVSLEIPKNQLVVFTGLSGCGKSTLLIDVLFNECQRQYLEAMSFQGIRKPKVDRIREKGNLYGSADDIRKTRHADMPLLRASDLRGRLPGRDQERRN